MKIEHVAIVGAGRVGLSLARALVRAGQSVAVLGRHAEALPDPLEPATAIWDAALAAADLILVAVPDDAIPEVALALARSHAIGAHQVVLHTSGVLDRTVLAALNPSGAALGSWHPLQSFTASDGDPDRFAGSPAVLEGDLRAVATGRELAALLHSSPVVELEAEGKAQYHAAAVFASNYPVVLAAVAARLARAAGLGEESDTLFIPLMRGSVANLVDGPVAALTGPIRRGDAGTVARHLAALSGDDRSLYLALGREALILARRAGLDPALAAAVEALLTDR